MERGGGVSLPWAFFYMYVHWCSGVPEIDGGLEDGGGLCYILRSVCHGYMCILQYMKLFQLVLHRFNVN